MCIIASAAYDVAVGCMLSAFARRSLLSSALAHRLAATSAPARCIVRLQSAAVCLQDTEQTNLQPQQVTTLRLLQVLMRVVCQLSNVHLKCNM